MKQTISRTISITTIKFAKIVVEKGEPKFEVGEPIEVAGDLSKKDALKVLSDIHINNEETDFTILSLEKDTKVYELSLKEFMEYATIIEPKSEKGVK